MEDDIQLQIDFTNQRINNMGKCFNEMKQVISNLQKEIELLKETKPIINNSEESEVWYDIKGWEGIYQISNFNNVKGVSREFKNCKGYLHKVKERILKPQYDKSRKTYYVILSYKGKSEKVYLQDIQINVNKQQNKETQFKYPKLQYVILQYDLNRKLIRKWSSYKQIEECTTFCIRTISECCQNKNKTYKNYYWEKVDLNNLK